MSAKYHRAGAERSGGFRGVAPGPALSAKYHRAGAKRSGGFRGVAPGQRGEAPERSGGFQGGRPGQAASTAHRGGFRGVAPRASTAQAIGRAVGGMATGRTVSPDR